MKDTSDGTACKRCDHVDPQVVVYCLVRRAEPVVIFPILVTFDVGVSVLADCERYVAASECWVKASVAVGRGNICDGCKDACDRIDLDQTVVCQLCVLVLDGDECEDQNDRGHEDCPEGLPVTGPIIINTNTITG